MSEPRNMVLIELPPEEAATIDPAAAAPPPDAALPGDSPASRGALALAGRRAGRLARWLLGLVVALLTLVVSVGLWDFATGLLDRAPLLGGIAAGLLAALALTVLAILLKEMAALARLGRIEGLRRRARILASAGGDAAAARRWLGEIARLYRHRPELAEARRRLAAHGDSVIDPPDLVAIAETTLMPPLDAAAAQEIAATARRVATITAIVPLPLADVGAVLLLNMRLIRRLAQIYGGRSGVLGAWRLLRAVLVHLAATGAVAAGDDMLHAALGGGLAAKLSRRFGEGVVNAALTTRVGIAAIEVCRPLPHSALPRPGVKALLGQALTGLFRTEGGRGAATEGNGTGRQ